MKQKNKKGAALVSILAVTAIVLIVLMAGTVVAIINSRMNLAQLQSQRAYQATGSLVDEVILRFIRERVFLNPYPDWTSRCLQITDFDCKMELNLQEDGGLVDVWGRVANKIRHFQIELDVLEDESVSVSARREL